MVFGVIIIPIINITLTIKFPDVAKSTFQLIGLAALMEDCKNWHVFCCSLWSADIWVERKRVATLKVARRRKAQISFNSWALIASSLVILISLVVPLWNADTALCVNQIRSIIVFMCSFHLIVRSFHLVMRSTQSVMRPFHSVIRSFHLVLHPLHFVMWSFHSVRHSFHLVMWFFHSFIGSFHSVVCSSVMRFLHSVMRSFH